ncbi:MAG: selenocysteine-specific translation elongation factor, partial [Candidatus Zipacnadales bacterium]
MGLTDSLLPNVVVGTAGHVDHGKTELVKALTGINTDRLAEEQERGLSIDLGFAHLDLSDGNRVGIVDVPGHERFIKNMLAGATGIDLVMLIVAADEGVMPQTLEHLNIVSLLGIDKGIIVITKSDLVERDLLDLVEEDIRTVLGSSPLTEAPLVRTSAKTGEGLEELKEVLRQVVKQVQPRDVRGPARLPIDRVFSRPGFGTIVTGTLVRGKLVEGDLVEILPQGYTARVRGLQAHGTPLKEVRAARRVAVNLMRFRGDDLRRGNTLCAPGSMIPSAMLDVRLTLLPNAPSSVKQRTRLRLHHGTAEVLGRVYFMDRDELAPGESAIAQLRLEHTVAAARGDRCVVRSYSPPTTIGGAVIIDPTPKRHRRRDLEVVRKLTGLESADPLDLARHWIRERGRTAFAPQDLAIALQLELVQANDLITRLVNTNELVSLRSSGIYVWAATYWTLVREVREALAEYHAANPLADAMPKEVLQARFSCTPGALLDDVLAKLSEEGTVCPSPIGIRLATHEVRLAEGQRRALEAMVDLARRARFAPPTREAVLAAAQLPDREAQALLSRLLAAGELVAVGEHLYHSKTIIDVQSLIM